MRKRTFLTNILVFVSEGDLNFNSEVDVPYVQSYNHNFLVVDALEEEGIEHIIQRYMSKPGTDLDLLQQFQIYEAVLQYEDGEETNGGNPFRLLDENIRKTLRCRKSMVDSTERRKSRRHSTGTSNVYALNKKNSINNNNNNVGLCLQPQTNREEDDDTSSSHSSEMGNPDPGLNGKYKDNNQGRWLLLKIMAFSALFIELNSSNISTFETIGYNVMKLCQINTNFGTSLLRKGNLTVTITLSISS